MSPLLIRVLEQQLRRTQDDSATCDLRLWLHLRMDEIEARVLSSLEATGFEHEIIACDPDLADTAAFCAHYGYPLEQSANTILVASKKPEGRYAACVVLATDRLDVNKKVRQLLAVRKLSFAPPDLTAEVTGMLIGGVTPFALPPDLPLWIDDAVMAREWVILGGGSRSLKVKADPRVLESLPNAAVIEGLALPRG
jgi:prolyl-tRNA editing enzyme YbaK/EbsC (Cys-tRNA(Pro) deacylase)